MTFFLLENRNPHAPRGYWGHPSRNEAVRLLVVHTSESLFDTSGADTGAENVANYLSNTDRAASYHAVGDSDSLVHLLPYSYTAFGARGHNAHAVHLAFAGRAADWPKLSDSQVQARLAVLASAAREVCDRFGIPVRRLVGAQARTDTATGICGHTDVDPDRRSDPGSAFPWPRFLQMIEGEDDMTPQQADMLERIHSELTREDIRGTVARYVQTTNAAVGRMEKVHGQGLANLTSGEVDPAQVAAAIADDLGPDVARQVADELARRLTS